MATSTVPYALVVEDDVLILMNTCDILEEAGFRFYEASTGPGAIALLEGLAGNVILLFSDVELEGELSGFDLARHVEHHWPWIEIVIASGHIEPQFGDMPEKATFIRKPFNSHIVHDHLQKALPDQKKPEPLRLRT